MVDRKDSLWLHTGVALGYGADQGDFGDVYRALKLKPATAALSLLKFDATVGCAKGVQRLIGVEV